MTTTTMIERLAEEVSQVLPDKGLDDAVQSFIETCDVHLDWSFSESADRACAESPDACRGSALALTCEGGTWMLIALCDDASSKQLSRTLFALNEDKEVTIEDTADALNEIVNVAAGVFKSKRKNAGERLTIGLPTYLNGDEALTYDSEPIRNMTRTIRAGDDVSMRIFALWQKGTDQ